MCDYYTPFCFFMQVNLKKKRKNDRRMARGQSRLVLRSRKGEGGCRICNTQGGSMAAYGKFWEFLRGIEKFWE